jgi:hypothetical protein
MDDETLTHLKELRAHLKKTETTLEATFGELYNDYIRDSLGEALDELEITIETLEEDLKSFNNLF